MHHYIILAANKERYECSAFSSVIAASESLDSIDLATWGPAHVNAVYVGL